jgi:hypothetical protein
VVDAEGHAETLAQGRWKYLCPVQGAEVVAERLHSLVRDMEREEAARGIPSLQAAAVDRARSAVDRDLPGRHSVGQLSTGCSIMHAGSNLAMGSCRREGSATATR